MSDYNFKRAKHVIKSLIHGNDPTTGEELPPDTVINRIEVNRAMVVAVTAIDQVSARAARRAQLPSGVGRTWSPDEEEALSAEFKRKEPIEDIAKTHRRTIRAIEARLERMGLLTPDQRTTPTTFDSPIAQKKGRRAKRTGSS